MTYLLALALLLLSLTLAHAQSRILRGNGEKMIPVWRDETSAEAGLRLATAGQLDLAGRYLACSVQPGTQIVVLPGGHNMQRVMIIEGKSRGCEGSVYGWDITGDRKQREAEWAKREQELKTASAGREKRFSAERECEKKGQSVYEEITQGRTQRVIEAIDAQRQARADCMTSKGYTDTPDHATMMMDRWRKDPGECGMRSGLRFDKYDDCLAGKVGPPASANQQGWPAWRKYLDCSEKRTDPAEDCTRHLQ